MDILEKKLEDVVLDGNGSLNSWMTKEDLKNETELSSKVLDLLIDRPFGKPTNEDKVKINIQYEISFFFPTWKWTEAQLHEPASEAHSGRIGDDKQEKELGDWVARHIHWGQASADPSGYGFSTWYNHVVMHDERFLEVIEEALEGCPKPYREHVEINVQKTMNRSWSS